MGGGKLRALVADTHAEVRSAAVALLGLAEYEVTTVGHGMEAVELATRERFDLALLNVNLPGTSGLAASTAIKSAWPATRVVLMSSDERYGVLPSCGADAFVVKPFALADLLG